MYELLRTTLSHVKEKQENGGELDTMHKIMSVSMLVLASNSLAESSMKEKLGKYYFKILIVLLALHKSA